MKHLNLDEKDNNYFLLKCKFEDKDLVKSISDARWDKDRKVWKFYATYGKYNAIKKVFGNNITIDEKVENHIKKIVNQDKEALEIKKLTDCDLEIKNIKTKLFPFQKVCIKFLLNSECNFNFNELGLGKTLQILATIIEHKNNNRLSKVIVIVPSSLKWNWDSEIKKHTNEKCLVIDGNKKNRIAIYEEFKNDKDILFLIVNYDLVRGGDIDILSKYLKFDAIICDESIRIKNPFSLTTKAVKLLSKNIKYRYAVSGYPLANNLEDIWSQVDYIRPGLCYSWWGFQDKFIERGYWGEISGYKNTELLHKLLQPTFIRFLKKDVLKDLPDKIYTSREILLEKDIEKAYLQMRDEMLVSIQKMDEEEIIAKTTEILTKLIRLSQITSGFITDKTLSEPYYFKSNPKLEALKEIIEEVVDANKRPIVIWCRFLPTTELLKNIFKDKYKICVLTGATKSKDRQEMVEKFQNGELDIFIGQIMAGGIGINLFRASTEVFYEQALLSPSSIIQATDRLHRIGQTSNVTIISLIAKNTIDEHWEKMMLRKKDIAEQILGDKQMRIDKQLVLDLLKSENE